MIFCGLDNVLICICDQRQIQSGLVFVYDHRIVLSDGDFLLNCVQQNTKAYCECQVNCQISEAAFLLSFQICCKLGLTSTCTLPAQEPYCTILGDPFISLLCWIPQSMSLFYFLTYSLFVGRRYCPPYVRKGEWKVIF